MQGLFNMASDSRLFIEEARTNYVTLYEAKFFWHFDHRFGSYGVEGLGRGGRGLVEMPLSNYQNPDFSIIPRYWVAKEDVEQQLKNWKPNRLIGFRDVTSAKLERSVTFSILPRVGVGHTAPLVFFDFQEKVSLVTCFLANVNSLVFDFIARQKIGGTHMTFSVVEQLPIIPPRAYTPADIDFIAPRVLELVYTANDLRPFAEDILNETGIEKWNEWFPENKIIANGEWRIANGKERAENGENHSPLAADHSLPSPFRWDDIRRAQLRAELDAYYARLYGLTRDELRYILDPKEVHGEDFPGETFRVLKEKEVRLYGEYRTRRLVLEAWDKMEG